MGLILFVAFLSRSGRTAQTARVYLAGVRWLHLLHRADISAFRGQRLAAALQGLHRLTAKPATKSRTPITLGQLRRFKEQLFTTTCLADVDKKMLWAAVSLAYFGLLRVSEYTSQGPRKFDPTRTLIRSRVTLREDAVVVHLPESKTDQLRKGADVTAGLTGDDLCPTNAVKDYVRATPRAKMDMPFFFFSAGNFLTPGDINFWLRRFISASTTSHSLRIGGTTAAAEAGAETWQILAGGRWRSNAYQRYIRPSSTAMGRLARMMTSHREPAEHVSRTA